MFCRRVGCLNFSFFLSHCFSSTKARDVFDVGVLAFSPRRLSNCIHIFKSNMRICANLYSYISYLNMNTQTFYRTHETHVNVCFSTNVAVQRAARRAPGSFVRGIGSRLQSQSRRRAGAIRTDCTLLAAHRAERERQKEREAIRFDFVRV